MGCCYRLTGRGGHLKMACFSINPGLHLVPSGKHSQSAAECVLHLSKKKKEKCLQLKFKLFSQLIHCSCSQLLIVCLCVRVMSHFSPSSASFMYFCYRYEFWQRIVPNLFSAAWRRQKHMLHLWMRPRSVRHNIIKCLLFEQERTLHVQLRRRDYQSAFVCA